MKRLILVLALLTSTYAYGAAGGESNNTGCNGAGNANSPCSGGTTTTSGGTASSSATGGNASAIGGNSTATGGTGYGGVGIGVGGNGGNGGKGGNASTIVTNNVETNPFAATFDNSNTSASSNQQQKQNQGQTQSQTQGQVNNQTQGVSNAANNTGNSSSSNQTTTIVQGDAAQARNPVSTALGPTIVTGSDQCLVALSVGVQAIGFGFAAGSAIADQNCEVLKLARQLDSMGYRSQALKLLLADPRVKAAFE